MAGVSFHVALNLSKFLAGNRQMESSAARSAAKVKEQYQRMADASAEAWARSQRAMSRRTAMYAKSDRFVAERDGGERGGVGVLASLGRTAVAMTLVNRAVSVGRRAIESYTEKFPELATGADRASSALNRMAVSVGRDLDAARVGLDGVINALESARSSAVAAVSGGLRAVSGGDGDVDSARAANEAAVLRGRAIDALGARRRELERELLGGRDDDESRIALARMRHKETLNTNARLTGITPQERASLDALAEQGLAREIAQIRERSRAERDSADARLSSLTKEAEQRAALAGLSESDREDRERILAMERAIAQVHEQQAVSAEARAEATERIVRAYSTLRSAERAAEQRDRDLAAAKARSGSIADGERRVLALEAEAARAQGNEGLAQSIDRAMRRREVIESINALEGLSAAEKSSLRGRALAALSAADVGGPGRDIFNARLVEGGQAGSLGTLRQVFGGPTRTPERVAAERQLDESKRATGLLKRIERNTAGGARFA